MQKYNLLFIYFMSIGLFAQNDTISEKLYQHSIEEVLELPVAEQEIRVGIASKISENIQEAPSVVSVITKEEIEILGAVTLADVLDRSPSFSINSSMYTNKTPMLRGNVWTAGQLHLLLLIDGRPNREILADNITITLRSFPVSSIKRIEIIRGAGSVLYGTNAFTGVINIVTKKSDKKSTNYEARLGNGETKSFEISQEASFSKVKMLLAGKYFNENPTLSLVDENLVDSTFKYPSEHAMFFGKLTAKNWRISGSYNQINHQTFVNVPLFPLTKAQKQRAWLSAGYTVNFSEKWTTDFEFTQSNYTMGGENRLALNSDNQLVEITNIIKTDKKINVMFGGYIARTYSKSVEAFTQIIPPSEYISIAGYGQADYKPSEKWKFIAGFQWNQVQNLFSKLVPRLSLIYMPSKRWSGKLIYGQAFRSPQALELKIDYTGLRGNPNLTPELNETLEMQISYRAEKLFADLVLFHSTDKNLIRYIGLEHLVNSLC